jgi:hypothetical protein
MRVGTRGAAPFGSGGHVEQAASRVAYFCLATTTTTIGTFIPLAPLSLHRKRAQPATCRARRRRKLGRELVG